MKLDTKRKVSIRYALGNLGVELKIFTRCVLIANIYYYILNQRSTSYYVSYFIHINKI